MEISVKHLKALLLFAGRNDVRYYLNGIAIQGRFAVATDGHKLAVYRMPEDSKLNVIIPRSAVEFALRIHGSGAPAIEVSADRIGRIFYEPIEGEFPKWRRVVPDDPEAMTVQKISFNGEYLSALAKAAKMLRRDGEPYFELRQETEHAIGVASLGDDDFLCLIMSARSENIPRVPAWALDEKARQNRLDEKPARKAKNTERKAA